MEETFEYDNLDRLTEIWSGSARTGLMVYDGYGRMKSKTADGGAVFTAANNSFNMADRPHALKSAAVPPGLFPSTTQTVSYTGFDKTLKVKQGNDSLVYTYGHDQQRIAMEEHVGGAHRTKCYVGGCEYVTETEGGNTLTRSLTYLTGPFGVFAVVEKRGGEETLHYILKDNLGSWTAVTDSEGNVEQRLSYDAWGSLYEWKTENGERKTFHFPLSAFHFAMYDPVMSSFLSVDRYVQHPESAQGFNRYAYCGHNPLRYVDPSGWEMVKPAPGRTPSSADYAMDPYAYAERAYEPRDLGLLQLPTDDPTVVWMEGNERHGVGKNGDLSVSTPSDLSENPPEGVEVHTGNCLLLKAFWHYQFGGGKDYWVDASTLDLYYISQDDLKYLDDGTATINLFEYSKTDNTALALGKISLEPIGDNLFEIKPDKYDFNIEWDQGWTKRNVATAIAGYLHGPVFDNVPVPTHWMDGRPCYAQPSVYFGGSFSFHFSNSVYIKP